MVDRHSDRDERLSHFLVVPVDDAEGRPLGSRLIIRSNEDKLQVRRLLCQSGRDPAG